GLEGDIRAVGTRDMNRTGAQKFHYAPVLTIERIRIHFERGKVHPVDKVLRRQFVETDRIRTAVPMKMNGPAALGIEPFVQGLCERRPTALMKLRQPDKHVGIVEELPQGVEFAL